MKCTIDRIEEGIAVLILQEDPRLRVTVPASILPAGCGEGDLLALIIKADPPATGAARERVSGLVKNLKKNR